MNNDERLWWMMLIHAASSEQYANKENIGSARISDLIMLLSGAITFRFGHYDLIKRSGWWEVYDDRFGYCKNPNDSWSHNFSFQEGFDYIKSKL